MDAQSSAMKIDRVVDETDQMRLFTLIPEREWTFIPGQVALLGLGGVGESYFAIASAPEDKGILEFLVKDGQGVAAAIYRLKQGDSLQAKGPIGKGFPIDDYKGRDLLIEAVGSAIAPMRGVIGSIIHRRSDFGKVTAIFGVRYPTDFPFTREIDGWREANIDIVLTLSRPEGTDWSGKSGYVTAHCEEVLGQLNGPVALVCGMKDMTQQSREELCRLGVDECEILTND
jgi:sulfhydrogenase subunit gamma (sulfur reductase)